ncbi:YetF domain-containing protein [Sphingomonas sp. ID0503]|uniref:YetF domain-containing protein n=1 Tax=Sphingomonas sp. ID0503 TaxID=3399691 RepID=UPI003AFA53B6
MEGAPTVVFRDGAWDEQALRSLHMAQRDIVTEVRQGGRRSMDEVEPVVAEHNGGISILPKRQD